MAEARNKSSSSGSAFPIVGTDSIQEEKNTGIQSTTDHIVKVGEDSSKESPAYFHAKTRSAINILNRSQIIFDPRISSDYPKKPLEGATRSTSISRMNPVANQMHSTLDNFFHTQRKRLTPLAREKQFISYRDPSKPVSLSVKSMGEHDINDFYLGNQTIKDKPFPKLVQGLTISIQDVNRIGENLESNYFMPQSRQSTMMQTTQSAAKEVFAKVKLANFLESLPVSLRNFYGDKKEFQKIFEDYNLSNFCLKEVVNKVQCYRSELGAVLLKVIATQSKIFEKSLEAAMKLFVYQEEIIEVKLKEIKEQIKKLEGEKETLESKNKNLVNLLKIAESSGKLTMLNVEKLESELKLTYEVLRQDLNNKTSQHQVHAEKDQESQKRLGINIDNSGKTFSERLQADVSELQGFFSELDREHLNKAKIIKDMSNHLKATLKKIKYDAGTQVDEGDLAWIGRNIGALEEAKAPRAHDINNIESTSINIEETVRSKLKSDGGGMLEMDNITALKMKDRELKSKMEEEALDHKKRASAVISLSQAHSLAQNFEDNWNLPLNMIVFLENVTKTGETAKVLPWGYFRKVIFEIYNDRLANKLEVCRSLINTFVPMSEYTCIFFMKKHKIRRVAELKLLEFLVSLKYYVKIWPRATMFANMCGITAINKVRDLNDVVNSNEYDVYAQNFVLFAYEKIHAETASIAEHPDGTSWLLKRNIEAVVNAVLVFENEEKRKKFYQNLQKQIRFIGEGAEKDAEGLDIDKFLMMFMDEYIEAKKRNIKAVTKHFYKGNQEHDKIISIDDFAQYLQEVNDNEITVSNLIYPRDITMCRAFLHALTSGKNNFAVNHRALIQSLSRFGVDCPFPFIDVGAEDPARIEAMMSSISSDLMKKKQLQKRRPAVIDRKKLDVLVGKTDSQNKPEENTNNKKAFESRKENDAPHDKPSVFKGMKLDSATALFAQQFSLIREMRKYCQDFSEMLKDEGREQEDIMNSFKQLSQILDRGCAFLTMPIDQ